MKYDKMIKICEADNIFKPADKEDIANRQVKAREILAQKYGKFLSGNYDPEELDELELSQTAFNDLFEMAQKQNYAKFEDDIVNVVKKSVFSFMKQYNISKEGMYKLITDYEQMDVDIIADNKAIKYLAEQEFLFNIILYIKKEQWFK